MERRDAVAVVERVAGSATFQKSPVARELLLYLARHMEEAVGEYAIGVDALGRKADFDPKTDATVRVQMSRLRQRLKDYYESEGTQDSERLQVPLGAYRLEVVARSEAAPVRRRDWWKWAAGVGAVALVGDNLRLRWMMGRRPELAGFWRTLLGGMVGGAGSVDVIVPAPLFFRWSDSPFVVRDFRVNFQDQRAKSEVLRELEAKRGVPEINQLYTVATDTLAASTVSRYLEERGVAAPVLDSPSMTVDLLAKKSTVVFVGPGTIELIEERGFRTNYYLKPGVGGVLDRRPGAGELEHHRAIEHAPLRSTSYGVFARLPGKAPGTQMLLFASVFNPALTVLLMAESELAALERLHAQAGSPSYFEALVRFERNADRVIQVRPVRLRALPSG